MGTVELVKRNITRNRFRDQLGDGRGSGFTRSHQLANLGGADGHQGQLQSGKPVRTASISIKLRLGLHGLCSISYTNYSNFKNVLPSVPLPEGGKLVGPNKQVDLRLRIFRLQGLQGVYGEGGTRALNFTVIHHDTRHAVKCQPAHGQPVRRGAECPRLVPGLAGGNYIQPVQVELRQRGLRQREVRIVRRIKRAAKHANTLGPRRLCCAQTQSRLTRNSL